MIVKGEFLRYDILDVFEFSSKRRRSGIVLRCPKTKKILLYEMGANTEMRKRLNYDMT